jgi:hypothetical protein
VRDDHAARVSDAPRIAANDRAILDAARANYAATRKLTPEAAARVETAKVVAVYYFESWNENAAQRVAVAALPYPQMLPAMAAVDEQESRLRREQPSNPFFAATPLSNRVAVANARIDQMIAALATVEAVRAYAAAHGGALPPSLDLITETPAPVNPLTGRPFGYTVQGDTAVLWDDTAAAAAPLRYEIRLRK